MRVKLLKIDHKAFEKYIGQIGTVTQCLEKSTHLGKGQYARFVVTAKFDDGRTLSMLQWHEVDVVEGSLWDKDIYHFPKLKSRGSGAARFVRVMNSR